MSLNKWMENEEWTKILETDEIMKKIEERKDK